MRVINKIKCFLVILFVAASVSASAADLSLDVYLKDVAEKNLALASANAALEASQAKAIGLNIPAPMLGFSRMRDQQGRANNFELSQTLPFPSKLISDHSARGFAAKADAADFGRMKNEVLAKARLQFISLWLSQERIKFLGEQKEVLQSHLKLSTASARSDSFLKIHTLKVESDLDLLDNEIIEAKQALRERQIQLAELAGQDPGYYQGALAEPPLSQIPGVAEISQPLQLESKRLDVEKYKSLEFQSYASWLPDFNFRYREVGGGSSMASKYNEVMLSVSLPFVFFWEPYAESKSASATRYKGEVDYTQERLRVDGRKASLLAKAESLNKELTQIREKLLPRAEKRMRLVHNIAPRDMESLQDHRETMEAFPGLKLKALELREQFETAVAELSSFKSESRP